MASPFRFKQFTIAQDRAAMKVGTDGVLLGAWVPLEPMPDTILDIGAGTGLIALMLAQRSAAETIDALEIDPEAFEQCVGNFEASPWADRLFCYHAGLDEFVAEMEGGYDLVVSNPPFYPGEVPSGDPSRDLARQQQALPFGMLLAGAVALLSPHGQFCLILPFAEEAGFIRLAGSHGLFPTRITRVRGTAGSPLKRSLLCFSFRELEVQEDELILEVGRNRFSEAYHRLTREFYLNR
jgi:tRNA1Val (adenine37-N6)-methyltransferase